MATKKSSSSKESSPVKKNSIESKSPKTDTQKVPQRKSSVLKKELSPITKNETNVAIKKERKSASLLKDAIEASKNKALENETVEKAVKRKYSRVKKTDNDVKLETAELKEIVKPETSKSKEMGKLKKETKTTYSKEDILRQKRESIALKEKDTLNSNTAINKKAQDIEIDDNTKQKDEPTTNTNASILSAISKDNPLDNKEARFQDTIKNIQEQIKQKQDEIFNKNTTEIDEKDSKNEEIVLDKNKPLDDKEAQLQDTIKNIQEQIKQKQDEILNKNTTEIDEKDIFSKDEFKEKKSSSILSELNIENKEDIPKNGIESIQEQIRQRQDEAKVLPTSTSASFTRKSRHEIKDPAPKIVAVSTPYTYKAPIQNNKKKSKKPFLLIFGVILLVSGTVFGIFQFTSARDSLDEIAVNEYISKNDTLESDESNIIENVVESTQTEEPEIDEIDTEMTETAIEQTNMTLVSEEMELETQTEAVVVDAEVQNIAENASVVKTTILENPPPTPRVPTPPVRPTPPVMSVGQKPYMIKWKDTLQSIAINELGDIKRWPTVYSLNKNVLTLPDSYSFGTEIVLPTDKKSVNEMNTEEKNALYNDYLVTIEAYKRNNQNSMAKILEAITETLR